MGITTWGKIFDKIPSWQLTISQAKECGKSKTTHWLSDICLGSFE